MILEIQNLSKTYKGGKKAVDNLSLEVHENCPTGSSFCIAIWPKPWNPGNERSCFFVTASPDGRRCPSGR